MNRAYFSRWGVREAKVAWAMTLVENAARGKIAPSIVQVRCRKLYTALYSRGIPRQIFSNTCEVSHLQCEDDQDKKTNEFTDTGHF